ncbi:uncharacterized protein LOC135923171 [Gordionus sp. m RMFG-2023]|uniref:uncharacterized protein LOC135923171 n=1 Tax=Gordionus sp. m RMFG-2023 TaxID=3053472 RepID=UPI0031FC6159
MVTTKHGRGTAQSTPLASSSAYDKKKDGKPGGTTIHENETYDGHKRPDKKWRNQFTGDRVRVATWNVGSMTGRAGEVVDVLHRRHIDVCCIQETRWKGNGTRMIGKTSEKYKFFWQGGNDGKAGVVVLVAEKLVDKVVEVRRLDNQIMVIKMIIGRKLYNMISAYVPQVGRSEEEKDVFWDSLLGVTSGLANEEGIILAGDLNGHVGASSEGYEGVHGGFSYGMRNLEGERILEFSDAMDMIVCNTMFKKESEKLMTYKSVIPGEECINQHRLVVGDLTLKGARVTKRKFVPRLKVWKLKEENARRQFNKSLAIREAEVAQASGVNDKWEAMKKAWVMTTEEVCGWTKGPPRHKETWWWSPEVAKAVDEKRRCFKVWYNSKENSDNDIYKMAKRNAKKLIAKAQEEKRHEFAKEMECADGIGNMVRMAKQMSKKRQDVIGVKCLKNMEVKMTIDSSGIKNTWKIYMKGLLNEENEWNNNISYAKVEGPGCKFGKDEIGEQ